MGIKLIETKVSMTHRLDHMHSNFRDKSLKKKRKKNKSDGWCEMITR